MHLNYNLDIRLNGHSSLQKVSPLCEGVGALTEIPKFIPLFSSFRFHFYNFLVFGFSLSPTVLYLLQVCINLYYIFFLFASNLLTIVQLFSNI
jgi:hypothetical protein